MMLADLFNELRANPRLRAGVWLIVAVLATYPLIWLHDYQASLAQAHAGARDHLLRLQAVSTQGGWSERAEQARALRVQMEDVLWQAATRGLAQATLQSWLQGRFRNAGVERARIEVENATDIADMPGLWKVMAKCEGVFMASQLENLLKTLAGHRQWLVVERLEALNNNRQPRFTLLVSAYFQAGQEETEGE